MVTIRYAEGKGWYDARVEARAPIPMDPATAVLHYAQEIFEGLKAYRAGRRRGDDVPAGGQRRAVQRLGAPDGDAGAAGARSSSTRCASWSTIDREWIPTGDGRQPLPAAVHVRQRGLPRRAPGRRSTSTASSPRPVGVVLLRRGQAGHRLGLAGLHPGRARRHRRGEVRRQLRRLAGRPGRGDRARLRPGGLPRRGGAPLRRRARRHERLLRLRRRHAWSPRR